MTASTKLGNKISKDREPGRDFALNSPLLKECKYDCLDLMFSLHCIRTLIQPDIHRVLWHVIDLHMLFGTRIHGFISTSYNLSATPPGVLHSAAPMPLCTATTEQVNNLNLYQSKLDNENHLLPQVLNTFHFPCHTAKQYCTILTYRVRC